MKIAAAAAVTSFPPWLDPRTLAWCAEYCEAMAHRLPAEVEGPVAADICATGIRQAIEQRRPRPPPARRHHLRVIDPIDTAVERSQARMEKLFGRDWLEGKE